MALYITNMRLPKKGRYTTFTIYWDGRVVFKFGGEPAGQATEISNAADVKPVMHGKWLDPLIDWECSACHELQGYSKWLKYCPNCGAKMEES